MPLKSSHYELGMKPRLESIVYLFGIKSIGSSLSKLQNLLGIHNKYILK